MRIVYTENKQGVSYEWGSFDEWYEEFKTWVKTEDGRSHFKAHGHADGGSLYSDNTFNERWFGHSGGFRATLEAIDKGWPEMRELLFERMQGIELELPVYPSMTTTRRRKRIWTDTGDRLAMDRVWNGTLETAWQRPVRTERIQPNNKRITVAFDVSDNGGVTNDQAMWRAALSLLLCDSLCKAGRVFEVWCIDSTSSAFSWGGSNTPRILWSGWLVKSSGDPVVLDRLAGMLGVGFLRTVGFMAQGMGPHTASSGLGCALHQGLPDTLAQRREGGEAVIRIAGCHSKREVIEHYRLAWEEIEAQTGTKRDPLEVTDYGTPERDSQRQVDSAMAEGA